MTNTTKWIIGVIVVILVVIGIVSANKKDKGRQDSSDPAVQTGPVKLGVIGPFSGDAASYGEIMRNVVALGVEEINNGGGIGGQQVEVIYEDGKCNGKDAASAMEKLASIDKVQAVIGGFCSGESLAAVPVATQNKVALFSPGSSSPDLTNISKFFARDYPSDASQGSVLASGAQGKSYKKVAVIQEQTPYAQGLFKVFNEKFTATGGAVVKEEFASQTTDFRSQLTKLRNENPDALFVDSQTAAVAARIFKQLQDLKWKPQLIINEGITGDTATISGNAAYLEGTMAANFVVDPNNQKYQQALAAYKTKFGKDADYLSYFQTVYDAVYIIKDAISSVGNNGEKIAAYLHSLNNWAGASGSVSIGTDGDRTSGYQLETIIGGKDVVAK